MPTPFITSRGICCSAATLWTVLTIVTPFQLMSGLPQLQRLLQLMQSRMTNCEALNGAVMNIKASGMQVCEPFGVAAVQLHVLADIKE